MPHNPLHKIGQSIFPGGNPFYQEDEDTAKLRTRMLEAERVGDTALAASLKSEIEAQQTHDMQQYMKMAATAGASSGGAAIASEGVKKPYGDTAMFNPKAMPPHYLPGTKPKEEEDLIAPGLFSPYGMYR
tara:strand:- start:97 stop:486 length:390 start_codon:yes stop_codon:yes gene_type:complete